MPGRSDDADAEGGAFAPAPVPGQIRCVEGQPPVQSQALRTLGIDNSAPPELLAATAMHHVQAALRTRFTAILPGRAVLAPLHRPILPCCHLVGRMVRFAQGDLVGPTQNILFDIR